MAIGTMLQWYMTEIDGIYTPMARSLPATPAICPEVWKLATETFMSEPIKLLVRVRFGTALWIMFGFTTGR
jgi:hypothetical protein